MYSVPIYLVRHGEASAHWGQSADPGLSVTGRQQARDAAIFLASRLEPGAQLVSSPLARARQTANPLSELTESNVTVLKAYGEIPAPVPLAQRRDWLRAFMGKSWQGQDAALNAWRQSLLSEIYATQRPAAIFTHFLVINTLVGHVLGTDSTLSFWPDNGSVTELRLTDDRLEIVTLGREMDTVVN